MDVFGRPSPFCADEKILHQLLIKVEQMVSTHLKKEIDSIKKKVSDFETKYNKKMAEFDTRLREAGLTSDENVKADNKTDNENEIKKKISKNSA